MQSKSRRLNGRSTQPADPFFTPHYENEKDMSHIEEGTFVVTDIQTLQNVLLQRCPTLELVKTAEYRTWATDHGSLVGDYPLPSLYQIKVLSQAAAQVGSYFVLQKLCEKQGVKLPFEIQELRTTPLTLQQLQAIKQIPAVAAAYAIVSAGIGHDAEYVIRNKDPQKQAAQYGIGLVRTGENEWATVCDFFSQGRGLLREPGLGEHQQVGDKQIWAGELKQAYNEAVVMKHINTQQMLGNPMYASVTREVLSDGTIKLVAEGM